MLRWASIADSSVLSYEEWLIAASEKFERNLSLGFVFLAALAVIAVLLEEKVAWSPTKKLLTYQKITSKIAVVFSVLLAFTFLNVEMTKDMKPDWFKKREVETKRETERLALNRKHELRLFIVQKKLENIPANDRDYLVSYVYSLLNKGKEGEALVRVRGYEEGDVYRHYDKPSVYLKRIHDTEDSQYDAFSYHQLRELRAENEKLDIQIADERKAVLAVVGEYVLTFIPEELTPLWRTFIEAMMDGSVDTAADQAFPDKRPENIVIAREDFSEPPYKDWSASVLQAHSKLADMERKQSEAQFAAKRRDDWIKADLQRQRKEKEDAERMGGYSDGKEGAEHPKTEKGAP